MAMKTILVVDDMAVLREPLCLALEREGFSTLTASNGHEALVLTKQFMPDLILLDVVMPVVDGLTCLRMLREDAKTRNTPVIMLTEISDQATVARVIEYGAKGYMLKSQFSMEKLIARINTLLEGTSRESTDRKSVV